MSQHDYIIDNALAPAFRLDLNLALNAIATVNSGATAPATVYANMLWYDTTNDLLKIRNEANSAWITMGTVDQTNNVFNPNFLPATQAEAQAGTDNVKGMTPLRVSQAITALTYVPIGVGQTWQDVSASRAVSTSYQNTTGRPISVNLSLDAGGNRSVQVSVNNSTWITVGITAGGSKTPVSFIVPASWYYRINGSTTIDAWAELR